MNFDLKGALPGALRKLDPRELVSTPVMLVVEIGAAATTVMAVLDPRAGTFNVTCPCRTVTIMSVGPVGFSV